MPTESIPVHTAYAVPRGRLRATCRSSKCRQPLESQLRNHGKRISIGVMVSVLLATLECVQAFLIERHRLAMEAAALDSNLQFTNANSTPQTEFIRSPVWVVVRLIWTNWSEAPRPGAKPDYVTFVTTCVPPGS